MEPIPDDILIAIATQLKRNDTGTNDLLTFIKVSQRWHTLGLPLLYGNISVTTRCLERFTNVFHPKYGKLVRSISLRVGGRESLVDKDPYLAGERRDPWNLKLTTKFIKDEAWISALEALRAKEHWSDNEEARPRFRDRSELFRNFVQLFTRFVPILSSLQNLASFSLVLETGTSSWCLLPRATIAGLVDALPTSCKNLELDTHGNDSHDQNDHVHVCDSIRRILPRMQNVRVRLGAMCSALFEAGPSLNPDTGPSRLSETMRTSGSISLPNIRSLVVNCGITASGDLLPQCGYEGLRKRNLGAEAWCPITSGLVELVTQHATILKNASILVLSPTRGDIASLSLDTQLRTDLVNKETWAFPAIPTGNYDSKPGLYLIRSPDGSEQVIRGMDSMDDIAEGHIWVDVIGGARLPAAALQAEKKGLPSFATGCVERPATDLMAEWLEAGRGFVREMRTYRNELKTGAKLVLAEKRTGTEFLALRPIKEITPSGWVRTGPDLDLARA